MKRILFLAVFLGLLGTCSSPSWSHNPFTSKPRTHHKAPEPLFKSPIFVKIILWQHQLKQKMSELIRLAKSRGNIKPLIVLVGVAFLYGVIHAAGPGHGKVVAVSYVLAHRPTVTGGVLFGVGIAFLHGFSGVAGIFGLRYLIQQSVNDTLASVTSVTQILSFGLIAVLGLVIFMKHGYGLIIKSEPEINQPKDKPTLKNLLPWVAAVGLVPCPAVVMVMLFCMSMDVMILGLCLSASIALGMGATIAFVVVAVISGKTGFFHILPEKGARRIEGIIGLLSGFAIACFGSIFFISTLNGIIY